VHEPFASGVPPLVIVVVLLNDRLGFVDPDNPEEPILQRQEIQEDVVAEPRNGAHHAAGHGIQDEVVGGREDGDEDQRGVEGPQEDAEEPPSGWQIDLRRQGQVGLVEEGEPEARRGVVSGAQRDCRDRQADQQGVAEVEGRHGRELVGEAVIRPDRALAPWPVDGIDEAVAPCLPARLALRTIRAQETRGHARPGREDDKRE